MRYKITIAFIICCFLVLPGFTNAFRTVDPYGPELAPADLTGWTTYSTPASVTATVITADGAGDGVYLPGLTVGAKYRMSISGSATVAFSIQTYGAATYYFPANTFGTVIFTAETTGVLIRAGGAGTITVNSCSLRRMI